MLGVNSNLYWYSPRETRYKGNPQDQLTTLHSAFCLIHLFLLKSLKSNSE